MKSTTAEHIRPIDQAVLDLLKQHEGMSVQDFTDALDVTATAVRQRLDRLVEVGLIERRKEGVGRGRPQYRYWLTALGMRYSSVSYADLASALWAEIMELPNPSLRTRIVRRVARRMSREFSECIDPKSSIEQRLGVIVGELARRKVPASLDAGGDFPVLQVLACPFPDLAVSGRDRHVCEMEQEMISQAVGYSVTLDCCRLDGHEHCQFRPVHELKDSQHAVASEQSSGDAELDARDGVGSVDSAS